MVRTTTKVSVVATIVELGRADGDLACEEGPFTRDARSIFVTAGGLLSQVVNASVAPHPVLASRVTGLQVAMDTFNERANNAYRGTVHRCKVYYKVARDVSARVITALEHSGTYLHELDYQHQRRVALQTAQKPAMYGRPIGDATCAEAADLVDALGRGARRRNHVVYWAPPAPPEHLPGRYIGRSRAMDQRCAQHPLDISNTMTTLKLPPLDLDEARNVEEALIAHWGTRLEKPNRVGDPLGELRNGRHEISPLRETYCARLLVGQFILNINGYGPYASALYTRGKPCPGIGGPR